MVFFTKNNLINILFQMSTPLVLSVGLTFVIILGSIDLSVEGGNWIYRIFCYNFGC